MYTKSTKHACRVLPPLCGRLLDADWCVCTPMSLCNCLFAFSGENQRWSPFLGWSRTLSVDLGLGTGKFKADPDPWSTAFSFGKQAQAGALDIAAALQGKTEYHKMRTRGFKKLDSVVPFAGDTLRPSLLSPLFFWGGGVTHLRPDTVAEPPPEPNVALICGVPCSRARSCQPQARSLGWELDGSWMGAGLELDALYLLAVASRWNTATRRVNLNSILRLRQLIESLPLCQGMASFCYNAARPVDAMPLARLMPSMRVPSMRVPSMHVPSMHASSVLPISLLCLWCSAGTEFDPGSEWLECADPQVQCSPDTQMWYYNGHFHPDDWTGTFKRLRHFVRRRLWARPVRPFTEAHPEESRPVSRSSAVSLKHATRVTSPVSPGQKMIIQGKPASWMHNDDVDVCSRCLTTKFSFTVRKHHCRFCGWVVCNDCTKRKQYVVPRTCLVPMHAWYPSAGLPLHSHCWCSVVGCIDAFPGGSHCRSRCLISAACDVLGTLPKRSRRSGSATSALRTRGPRTRPWRSPGPRVKLAGQP